MDHSSSHATRLLLSRACTGDVQAVDDLLGRVSLRLTNLAQRMLGEFPRVRRWAETGDVLQNALVRLVNALKSVKPASPRDFFALASLQIRRELIDLVRHYHGANGIGANHHSAPPEGAWPPEPADTGGEPCSLLQWGELHAQIEDLPPEEREIVGLLFYQSLTQQEASDVLNVSLRTVQRRWHSALVQLHRRWKGAKE